MYRYRPISSDLLTEAPSFWIQACTVLSRPTTTSESAPSRRRLTGALTAASLASQGAGTFSN